MPLPLSVREWLAWKVFPRTLRRLEMSEALLYHPDFTPRAAASNAGGHLLITHGRGGGVDAQVRRQTADLRLQERPAYGLLFDPFARQFILRQEGIEGPALGRYRFPTGMNALMAKLRECGIRHIHLHHLRFFPLRFIRDFAKFAAAIGASYDVMLHDFTFLCPRVHAVDQTLKFCGLPEDTKICNRCIRKNGMLTVSPPNVGKWRAMHHALLKQAQAVFAPSQDTVLHFRHLWPDVLVAEAPHEPFIAVSAEGRRPRLCPGGEKLQVAVVGNIHRMKGADVLLACARDARARDLPIVFTLIGDCIYRNELRALGVLMTGPYPQEHLPGLLKAVGAHVVFLPSVWPETYSFVLSEVWQAGYFPAAFDIGAPAERIREAGAGELMPLAWASEPARVNDHLLSLKKPA